jgi:GNAT superfamily N-acetyltransferase
LDFFRERGGKIVETEFGWCNYYIIKGSAYLENMHIYKEYRNQQNGTALLMRFETQIKEIEGIGHYFTTINRLIGDPEKNLKICLKRGFKMHSMNEDAIYLQKEI